MTEKELLVDCLRRLNRIGVQYMLTGSMASNYWGIPRSTHDLDFVIQLPPTSIPDLVREFGDDYYIDADAIRSAYAPPYQFNAIDQRSALKVDFWLSQPIAFERTMFGRRASVQLFGAPAWIATAEDVLLHKLYWNKLSPSDRQLTDAAGIIAVQGEGLDRAYLGRWANELGLGADLEALFSGRTSPKTT
jgi:hypothetical protein